MTWPKTGATHYHAQLGIPDKGRAIKELVVSGKFSHTSLVQFGQEKHQIILNCVFRPLDDLKFLSVKTFL